MDSSCLPPDPDSDSEHSANIKYSMKYRTPAATGAWPNTDDDNNKSRIKTSSSSGGGDPTRQRRRSSRRSQQSQDVKNNRNNNSKQQRDANKPPPHVRSFNSKLKTKMSPPLGSARQNSIFASLQQDSILRAVQKSGLGASMNTGKGSNGTPESPNAGRRNVFSSMRKNSQGTKLNSIQFKPEETDRLPDSDVSNSNDGSGGSSLESLGVGISNNSKSEVMDLRPSVALAGLEDSLLSLNRPSDHDVKSSSESDDKKTNDPKVSKPSRLLRPARGLFGFMRGNRDHHKAMEVDFGHSGNHSDNSHSKNSGKGHGSDGSGSYKRVVTLMMEEGTKLGKDGRQRDRNIDGSFISDGSSLASSKWISGGEDDGDDYQDVDSQNSDDTELSPLREAKRKRRKLRHRQAKMARRFANVLAAAIVAIAAVAVMIPYIFDDEIEVFGFVMVFDKWLVKPNLRTGEVVRAPQQGEEYPEQTDVRQLPFHEDVMDSEEHVDIMAGGNADNNNNNNNNDEMIIGRENYRQRQARLKRERTQRIRERRERELALKQRQEEELADLRANRERKLAQDRETRVRQNMEERALREREREERVQAKMRRDQRVLLRQGQRRQPRLPSFQWYEEELQRRGGLRDAN